MPKRSVTLGEANNISAQTGREVSLVWDRTTKRNLLTIGAADYAPFTVLGDKSRRMTYHTHPRGRPGSPADHYRYLPSPDDREMLVLLQQQESFLIPVGDRSITKFGRL